MATHVAPEVRRAQILAAAQACFGRTGYHKTTMDDIVREAGLSKGSLYWHFKSKDEIFLALLDEAENAIFAAWDDLAGQGALETLRRESEVVLEAVFQDRAFIEMWTEFLKHPLARERFARIYERSRERLADTIEGGIAKGEIAPCDARHAAAAMTALVEGLLIQALADPGFDALAAWPTAWEIVAKGLRSTPMKA
jgi:AcrR family transcriptional regulator